MQERYSTDEILVISPYNVGTLGTYAINARIQSKYNPNAGSDNYMVRNLTEAPNGKVIFYEGDKVINKTTITQRPQSSLIGSKRRNGLNATLRMLKSLMVRIATITMICMKNCLP